MKSQNRAEDGTQRAPTAEKTDVWSIFSPAYWGPPPCSAVGLQRAEAAFFGGSESQIQEKIRPLEAKRRHTNPSVKYNAPCTAKKAAKWGCFRGKQPHFNEKSCVGRHLVDIQKIGGRGALDFQGLPAFFGRHLVDMPPKRHIRANLDGTLTERH